MGGRKEEGAKTLSKDSSRLSLSSVLVLVQSRSIRMHAVRRRPQQVRVVLAGRERDRMGRHRGGGHVLLFMLWAVGHGDVGVGGWQGMAGFWGMSMALVVGEGGDLYASLHEGKVFWKGWEGSPRR